MDIDKILEYALRMQISSDKCDYDDDLKKISTQMTNVLDKNFLEDPCKHLDVIDDGGTNTCADCGSELSKQSSFEQEWRYYGNQDNNYSSDPSRCHYRKVTEKSIHRDVESMDFPTKIVITANRLFEMVTKGEIYRGNSRKAIIFACIFQSFKRDGNPKSLEYLQIKFGLKRKVISKGMNHFGMNVRKDVKLDYRCISPNDLIPEILQKLHSDKKHVNNVLELYKIITNRSSLLNRSKPQSIGSGLVWYYCVYTKKSTTIKELSTLVKLSDATIEKIAKEIDRILGTGLFKKRKEREKK
jgi:transcription initiation factor TFIIIB Brf1 subunit/transcription initiation factor TFIIB